MLDEQRIKELIEEAVAKAIAPFLEPHKPVLLSRKAVCKRLNKNESTLYRWAKTGYLRVATRIGGETYYDERDIIRLESGQIMR